MRLLFSFLIFAYTFSTVLAQTGEIKGILLDAVNKKPLNGAKIYLNGTVANSTSSNSSGNFSFSNLQPGKYSITVGFYSNNDSCISNVIVNSGQTTPLNILLKKPLLYWEVKDSAKVMLKETKLDCAKSYHYHYKIKKSALNANHSNFNTEEYKYTPENEFKKVQDNPLSTFSIDVDNASYSNVRRFIHEGKLPPADAVRVEEMINYFKYDYLKPSDKYPFSIFAEAATCPWNKENKLVHIGIAGKEIDLSQAPANNLTFLIDVSGSMMGDLDLVKSSLRLLVNQMRPQDQIAIVVYAGAAGLVLPSTKGNKKDVIWDAIEKLEAGGSTAGGEGILLAYNVTKNNFIKEGNNRIIMATDGDFNVGVSSEGELVRIVEEQRKGGIYLTTLGFGSGNYNDSKMEILADKGNGNYYYIDNILEAKKVLIKQMGGTLYTIAKDVKLQVEFNPAYVREYRLVGYENRLLNNEDFNDDTKDAGELGAGHSVTALYEIVPVKSTSEINNGANPLRYQENNIKESALENNEWMFVKIRYKNPEDSTSQLMSFPIKDIKSSLEACSNNFKFSAAVAAFGQQLRGSKFKGTYNYTDVLELAKSSKGVDEEGYRAEFVKLVEMAMILSK